MADVIVYSRRDQLGAQPGQRQQAQRQDSSIGEGLQALGQGVRGLAAGQIAYQEKVDDATASDLDASFGNDVRAIESSFLSAKGKNAVEIAAQAQKAWSDTAASYLTRTNNPRQAAMLNEVIAGRRQRWASQYEGHLTKETDSWRDSSETSRIGTMSVDVANLPVNSVERTDAVIALGSVLDERAKRLGMDAEARKAMGFETFSTIHENTIGALLESGATPFEAEAYLNANAAGIAPAKRNVLAARVRDQVEDYTVSQKVRDLFQVDDMEEVEVDGGGVKQTLRMAAPVSAALGSRYGPRQSPGGVGSSNHKGADYPIPANSPVSAALPGVARVRNDPNGYGQYVEIDHGGGLTTRYAHVGRYNVKDGQRVEQGDTVAFSGGERGAAGAGNSQGAHLHFEVRRNGAAVNPEQALGQNATVGGAAAPRRQGSAMPTTGADVERWAAAESSGDWRMRNKLEAAAYGRISQDRSARADAEGEAMRELEDYLPHGRTPVASISAIPPALLARVSPAQRRSAAAAIEAEAKRDGDGQTDEGHYGALDRMARTNPQGFAAMDLTEFSPHLSKSDMRRVMGWQADARLDPNGKKSPIGQAMASARPQVERLAQAAGLETDPRKMTQDDQRRLNNLNRYVEGAVNTYIQSSANGTPPTDEMVASYAAIGLRQTRTEQPAWGPLGALGLTRNRGGLAFEQVGETVVPSADRQTIIKAYRDGGRGVPTQEQIQEAYMVGLRSGRFANETEEPRGRR